MELIEQTPLDKLLDKIADKNWMIEERNGILVLAPELCEQNDGFDPQFFGQLSELESWYFWFQARNQLILWVLEKYFFKAHNMLEIGCGNGNVLSAIQHHLPQLDLYGSEIFLEGLQFAKTRVPEAILFQADARNLPFKDSFDLIGAFDVLEHIQEDEAVIAQLHQSLKPGGGLLLTVPQHPFLWSRMDEHAHHKRRYTQSDMIRKLQNTGFKILKTTSFVSLLMPLLIAFRLINYQSSQQDDLTKEYKISPFTNALLRQIMRLEFLLIRTGMTFPYGSSLLIVAEKH